MVSKTIQGAGLFEIDFLAVADSDNEDDEAGFVSLEDHPTGADPERQLEVDAARITSTLDPASETLQQISLRPKRKDISILWSGILWLPFWNQESGAVEAAFGTA